MTLIRISFADLAPPSPSLSPRFTDDPTTTPRARGGAGLGSVSISNEFPDVSRFFSVRDIQDIINKVLKAAKIAGVSGEGLREASQLFQRWCQTSTKGTCQFLLYAASACFQDEGDNLQHKGDPQANLVKV